MLAIMDLEDAPKTIPAIVVGEELGLLSVEELQARIATLEAEIERYKEAIAGKQASKAAADAFFRA